MLSRDELLKIKKARLRDAEVLYRNRRYDGAIYLCGYAVEIALKARICKTLEWNSGFPETKKEFEGCNSFKTHDLEALLHLSGIETKIKSNYLADWSTVATWNPESRYKAIGSANKVNTKIMIDSVKVLVGVI